MAAVASRQTRLIVGDCAVHSHAKGVTGKLDVAMADATVLTDSARVYLEGLAQGDFQVPMLLDSDTAEQSQFDTLFVERKQAGSGVPMSVAPAGYTIGNDMWLGSVLQSELSLGSPRDDVVTAQFSAQLDGCVDLGKSLHNITTAETATGNATSVDNGASSANGGAGVVQLITKTGGTSIAVKIQHSADNATWADLITFTTLTAVGSQLSTVTGTVNRYLRASWTVTGGGSYVFACGFARR
jgi:hypothetical protein